MFTIRVCILVSVILNGALCREVCIRHTAQTGVSYIRCDNGCCGTTHDRYCCVDSLTLTIVLSLLGCGALIVSMTVLIWYLVTHKDRTKVGPETAFVTTQTDAA